jgi:hydroxymethylpyrimidine/phosphomethylpyrimidine kinase
VANRRIVPCALTIAGSDSGGGAGIQADLKTFATLGVHGTSAITCLTAQNPKRVLAVGPVSVRLIETQLEAVFAELPPRAIKTGMLFSAEIIKVVAGFLSRRGNKGALVVDPVMVATSGGRLLKSDAIATLETKLLPMADLITPNVAEAEALAGELIREPEDLRKVARKLHRQFGCGVLLKGGHLRGIEQAMDIFYDGNEEVLLSARFVRGISTHGTGCTYSAAIAAYCARGKSIIQAVRLAKGYITRAISNSARVGRHHVLGP